MMFLKRITIVFLLGLSTLVAFLLYKYILSRMALPAWDESHNIYYGYWMRYAFIRSDWQSAYKWAYDQVFYPPFQSIVIGAVTSIIGFSIEKVRLISLICLPISIVATYKLGGTIDKKHGYLIGVVSALILTTSPLLLFLVNISLKEALGLALSLITLWTYTKTLEQERGQKVFILAIVTGVLLFLLYLLKYNYPLTILLGIGISSSFVILKKILAKKVPWKKIALTVITLTPFALGVAWWSFSDQSRTGTLFFYLSVPPILTPHMGGTVLSHLFYIPRALGSLMTLSFPIAILLLAGFILALRKGYKKEIPLLHLVITSINFIYITSHFAKQNSRYLIPNFPSFVFLGVTGWIWLYPQIKDFLISLKRLPIVLGTVIAITIFSGGWIILDLINLPRTVLALGSHEGNSPVFDELNFKDTTKFARRSSWVTPEIGPNHITTKDISNFIFQNIDVNKPVRFVGTFNEMSPLLLELLTQMEKDNPKFSYQDKEAREFVVTIEVAPESIFYTTDYLMDITRRLGEIEKVTSNTSYHLVKERLFVDLKVKVKIFKR